MSDPKKLPTLRDDLALVDGYHSPQLDVTVRLNTNEAPESPPAEFFSRLSDAISEVDFNRYPDRDATKLRAAIAKSEGVDVDHVFAANGSNEVLQSLMLAYGGHGRKALTFEPTYALHSHISRMCGTEVVSEQRDENFGLSADFIGESILRNEPAVVFLCTPNNPTGMLEPPENIEAAIDAVGQVGALLVVDEAYGQFAPRSYLESVSDDVAMVVSRTYSKTWSMAASRLGYLVCPTWVRRALESVVLPYHLDAVKQLAGIIALDYEDEMHKRVADLVEQRGIVQMALDDLDVEQWPSASNFILFRPKSRSGREVWEELVERSILVRDCSTWPSLDECLRITLGTADENAKLIAALGEILGSND